MERVNERLYLSGILDIIGQLCAELGDLLLEEDRTSKRTNRQINEINSQCYFIRESNNLDSDIDAYEKILHLLKTPIIKEYQKLLKKGLSPADSSIVVIKRLIDIVLSYSDSPNHSESKLIRKFINQLWERINNKKKKDPLFNLTCKIRDNIHSGEIGKYNSRVILLNEHKKEKKKFMGSNSIINESDITISEIEM